MQFHRLHASGHLNKDQLVDMVNNIQPERLFPVHTENQHRFKDHFNNAQTAEQGKEYVLW